MLLRRDIFTVLARSWKLIAWIAIACGLIALLWAWGQKPVYEAGTSLLVTSGTPEAATAPYENAMGSEKRAISYAKLVYSEAVLSPAVNASGVDISVEDAKSAVSASVVPETALLRVAARDTDPAVAEKLANAVSRSLADAVSDLERPPGSTHPASKLALLSPAIIDPHPVYPTTVVNVILSLAIGSLVGAAVALVRERRNRQIRDGDDVSAITGSEPIAVIPDDPCLADQGLAVFGSDPNETANAFRELRNRVSAQADGQTLRTIGITGCQVGAGTTTVTANLAAVLFESGKSVVVVDANYLNPDYSRRYGDSSRPSLTDLVRQPRHRASTELPQSNAGPTVVALHLDEFHNGDRLYSSDIGAVFESLRQEYDYVLVDTVAMSAGPNTTALLQRADGLVLVAATDGSTSPNLLSCIRRIQASDVNVLGVVLNQRKAQRGRRSKRKGNNPVTETADPAIESVDTNQTVELRTRAQ